MATAHIIAGLGFGDEGKGASVDALCRRFGADLVVKYTGGPQASHTVCLSNGRSHRFSQFGSGSFLPDCRTHLTRHVLVEPFAMMNEADALGKIGIADALDRIIVDPECIIVTPWHWMANQIRELTRGDSRHGSCGMGIGETKAMLERDHTCLRVRDLGRPAQGLLRRIRDAAFRSLPMVQDESLYQSMCDENVDDLMEFYNDWARRIRIASYSGCSGDVVFEGSQGVLLDETHGFAPHNTWSNTTFDNALEACMEWGLEPVKMGVLRTYMTRHGAGPFVTEDPELNWPDHNLQHPWQGTFRQGAFDLVMARYAIEKCKGIDGLILTHMDRAEGWKCCTGYEDSPVFTSDGLRAAAPIIQDGLDPIRTIEQECGIDIQFISSGPTSESFSQITCSSQRRSSISAAS